MNHQEQDKIVITGMGAVTPIGRDLATMWANVRQGHAGIGRWNGVWGGLMQGLPVALCQPYQDDAQRAVSFAREAALAALQDAGLYSGNTLCANPDRFGITVGSSKGGLLALEKALGNTVAGVSAETMEQFFHHGANVEIMRRTGICGPCVSLVSACATGAHSMVQAARWIQDDVADHVLAGAAESSLTPLVLSGFDRMGVLTKSLCRPYDRNREGFVVGEGAGVVVLEKFSTARKRSARIYAELSGWGITGDATKPVAFDPEGLAIERALRSCMKMAKWTAQDIDYINCHGTGTRENDRLESRALRRLFGKGPQTAALSSTKPMTGHLLGAAGSVELIVTALAMQNDFVPATLNLENPDPDCGLNFTAHAGRPKAMRNAMSLSYGFGGHVAALALNKVSP